MSEFLRRRGTIWIDGVSYYKVANDPTGEKTRAAHAKIEADRVALHGPDWEAKYLARKHREMGTLN